MSRILGTYHFGAVFLCTEKTDIKRGRGFFTLPFNVCFLDAFAVHSGEAASYSAVHLFYLSVLYDDYKLTVIEIFK